jgi:AraC-like DNA-binding protein
MSARLLKVAEWEKLAAQAYYRPSTMADLCPVSLRELQRFFVKQFNKTPKEWTRELRCRIARKLIIQGWSNKAIASELHFAHETHFCREFKRVYGFSPQSFAPVYGTRDGGRSPQTQIQPQCLRI